MKNMNIVFKSIHKLKKNLKSTKLVKLMMIWVNKLGKITHIKPTYLLYILGLLIVSLVTLGFGMFGRKYREGNTAMDNLNAKKIQVVDAMNCAINNSTSLTQTREMMRKHINHYYDAYKIYLDQDITFNTKNDIDKSGNSDNKIYKLKNSSDISSTTPEYIDNKSVPTISTNDLLKYELVYVYYAYEEAYIDSQGNGDKKIYKIKNDVDISGNIMPKYIDNIPLLPATSTTGTPSLDTYSLIDVINIVPISKSEIDALENYIKTTDFNVNATSKEKLIAAFGNLKAFAKEDFDETNNNIINIKNSSIGDRDYYVDTVNSILNHGSVDPCDAGIVPAPVPATAPATATVPATVPGASTETQNSAYWKLKYENLQEDIEKNKDETDNIWKEKYIRELRTTMGSDMANADEWKKLYLELLKKLNDYTNYAISHNQQYHGNTKVQGQSYDGVTGWPGNNNTNTATAQGNVPPGDEDLYMLKTGMVPPSNPPGAAASANGNASANGEYNNPSPSQCNSCKPAPVPPCPPCERCPEPDFDCKRVPKYNKADGNRYLPRPILADFSQFGM